MADGGAGAARVPTAGTGRGPDAADEIVPAEVALAFHPRTLAQLLYVRSSLQLDERVDRFLAAAITGILHGKSQTYLSELMPNTFSMAPRYVRDFAARTVFASPERDVFACLDLRSSTGCTACPCPRRRASRSPVTPGTPASVPGRRSVPAACPIAPVWS